MNLNSWLSRAPVRMVKCCGRLPQVLWQLDWAAEDQGTEQVQAEKQIPTG